MSQFRQGSVYIYNDDNKFISPEIGETAKVICIFTRDDYCFCIAIIKTRDSLVPNLCYPLYEEGRYQDMISEAIRNSLKPVDLSGDPVDEEFNNEKILTFIEAGRYFCDNREDRDYLHNFVLEIKRKFLRDLYNL
jgi:hypothetical protein